MVSCANTSSGDYNVRQLRACGSHGIGAGVPAHAASIPLCSAQQLVHGLEPHQANYINPWNAYRTAERCYFRKNLMPPYQPERG